MILASSLLSNSLHISFDSVLGVDDAGLGISVEISEEVFAAAFELPMEGFTDLSEVPKDMVFDARSLFSESKEQLSISCKKKDMKIDFRLLGNILAKTIYVKAGSFDEVTHERFLLMIAITYGMKINWSSLVFDILKDMVTPGSRQAKGYAIQICVLLKNVPGLELGESRAFPSSRILTEKTVHRYVVINEKVGGEVVADAPRVKKTPTKKAASKKRPATDAAVAPVVKKKRTTKSKTSSSTENMETLPVEAVPLQMIAPIPVVDDIAEKAVEPIVESVGIFEAETAVDSVNVETVVESVDESVYFSAVVDVLNEGISTGDEVDIIIEQVIAETAQLKTDEGEQVDEPDANRATVEDQAVGKADEVERWIDLPYEVLFTRDTEQMVTTASDTDEEFIADQVFGTGVEKMETEAVEQTADEAMSLEGILMTIPVDFPLPSAGVEIMKIILGGTISIPGVNEGDWYKASLPKIPATDKGKAPLLERDPVKGNPIKEQFSLILADIETNNALGEVMNKIDHVKRVFLDSIAEQNETFRGLFKRSRQEAQNDNNALSLALKAVRNQNVILSTDLEATRKEVRDIKAALSKDFDDKLANIRNELLEFRVDTQGQLASLSTHLAELIAFLTKGSDDKKGEGSSSRPQPPPDNQSRPSGGNGGSGNRAGEQSRYRGGSRSRGDRSGSSKRRYSSSGGGPFRRSFEDWIG
ncbi:hypothetical protein F511_34529 [Dorcoceras hygrometricum]|uniref:Uncharacterized protein n=1 Tax=Dorcoceras hygrometricum TaxID=472368 RepID=A0A2Z7C3N7_9LAMI|nr:hypothetical protein F511_34529 [Dorcoceras hygrometricum]